MKNILMLVLAFVIVNLLWHIVSAVLIPLLGAAISIGLVIAFCYAVYVVYRMLTREKSVM